MLSLPYGQTPLGSVNEKKYTVERNLHIVDSLLYEPKLIRV